MLLIDAGNSRIKSSLWRDGSIISTLEPVETASSNAPAAWHGLEPPAQVLVSSVAGSAIDSKITSWTLDQWSLQPRFAQVRQDVAGMTTRYERPDQLGVDRWLAALGGYHLAQGAVCVVDAGTAMTIDIVDDSGVHLGGTITPGLSLMVRSLTHNTARLRLDKLAPTDEVATNTAAAISAGCIDAFAGGIERMQGNVARILPGDVQWFVTGGEAPMVMQACHVDFRHVPDLVLRGLVLAEGGQP